MNVIHINSDYGNTIYKNLSDELFKLGVSQRVFKFVRPNNFPQCKYDDFVDVRQNYKNFDRYFFHIKHHKAIKDFLSLYNEKEVRILHAHTLFSNGYIAYKINKIKNIPYIVTVRSTDIEVFFKYMIHLRKTGIKILKNALKITFLSYAHRKIILEKFIPKKYRKEIEKKTVVIPNGIDNYYFSSKGVPKNLNKANEITIMTAAWINKNKNQINVCKAIEALNKKGYKIKYKIIGGVEKPNYYKDLVEELKSYSFVQLLPRKSKTELLEEYKKIDLFVMVSHRETFGLSYIESLIQCVPIIYSKNQGVDGYFQDGSIGYAAISHSPMDIAEKIELAIINYENLSKNAVGLVEIFKWNNIAKKYLDIYKSIDCR